MATGQTFGLTVQCFFTGILCLVLGLVRSYQLTLIIFITFPLVLVTAGVIEKLANPLVENERNLTASASTLVERAISAIPTVKAFNAEASEASTFLTISRRMKKNYDKLTMYWGFRLGVAQFFLLMSFVQGFWYGNHLVKQGKLTPGQATEVFWAIMIASGAFQQIIPFLNLIEQGKIGMAGLLNMLRDLPADEAEPPHSPNEAFGSSVALTSPVTSPTKSRFGRDRKPKNVKQRRPRPLRKIQPSTFRGELALHHVSFWYPTRPYPAPPTLRDVSVFLPAKEMTFIVGQSGSGKSTIGVLLLSLYSAQEGIVEADEQGIEWLDEAWLRQHISLVSQSSVIFEGTVHDNVAIGALDCRPEDVPREKVVEACRIALVHDFVRDLPEGYDTMLSGEKGASLSGGQRQRLAIARAYIRNSTVLILGKPASR
jgi:ATP-binding cassette subfamily B (MDR/TAP) protein 1